MSDRPTDPSEESPRKVSPLELGRIALRGVASYLAAPRQGEPTGADTPAADLISPDTRRERRLPPGQVKARKWPVLHAGRTPTVDLTHWRFRVGGLVERPRSWSWQEFRALPSVAVYADMHCVTRWSLLDNIWEGVAVREVLRLVEPKPEARFVLVNAEEGYTTNLPLANFAGEDCLFA
jgi:DMSO/TMAO reductase YedYZ molybdopterin-dependent catalytic subunit